jgi:protease I
MAAKTLANMRVAVLATDDFEYAELVEPRKALDAAGARTFVIAPKPGQLEGVRHREVAGNVPVDGALSEANPDDFDAVLIPGGALNADALRVDRKAQDFVRRIDEAGKPIAVICHGPWLLASAGLVRGRTLTGYHTIKDDLANAGAVFQDREVVRDRNWVSSRQPADLPAFIRAMVGLFTEYQRGGDVRQGG